MPDGFMNVIFALAIAGLVLWAITQFDLDATIKKLIKVVVIVVVSLYVIRWLATVFGGSGTTFPKG